jgi:phage shock protein C
MAARSTKTEEKPKTRKGRPKKAAIEKPVEKQAFPTRLYRSENDRVLGGVAGGLAEYFNLDSTLLRLVFVLLLVFGGSGLLIYIILWIVMPSQGNVGKNTEEYIKASTEEIRDRAEGLADEIRTGQNTRQIIGILVLAFGVMLLLQNFGYLNIFNLGRLWPLILIILGIAILTRHGKK